MRSRAIRSAARCTTFVAPLLWAVSLLGALNFAVAAAIGDQVELQATHPSGVPLHQAPRGTKDFQRIPDGTRARVTDVAHGGQWLQLSLPDGRTGWVTSRDVRGAASGSPSPGISPITLRPQRIEEGMVQRVADGDTITVITPNQTTLRIRMWGIDAPETPKGAKFPGQPYGTDAEAYLAQTPTRTLVANSSSTHMEIFGQ